MKTGSVFLLATMDTKAKVTRFFRRELEQYGLRVILIDMGILKKSPADVDIPQSELLGVFQEEVRNTKTRAEAFTLMSQGLFRVVSDLYKRGELAAAVSLGGSGGTALASLAMRTLPLGVPKVIVSTMASGNTLPYVCGEDILLINPVVDIQNLNFLTCNTLRRAAGIVAAMLTFPLEQKETKGAIAISGFGVTTPCVDACVNMLEQEGYEVLVFHARGISGGRIMEKMIDEGHFVGVLDLTTSEIADEIGGGIYAVGPQRLSTATRLGIPYVVTAGALEMINLGSEEMLTEAQKRRVLYQHSPSSVKMRANAEELRACARLFIERLSQSKGNVVVLVANKGFSMVNKEGQVFYAPKSDAAFIRELEEFMPSSVPVRILNMHQNDIEFAQACVQTLLTLMAGKENRSYR